MSKIIIPISFCILGAVVAMPALGTVMDWEGSSPTSFASPFDSPKSQYESLDFDALLLVKSQPQAASGPHASAAKEVAPSSAQPAHADLSAGLKLGTAALAAKQTTSTVRKHATVSGALTPDRAHSHGDYVKKIATQVPLPASIALVLLGLLGISWARRIG